MLITGKHEQLLDLARNWNALPLVVWLLGKDDLQLTREQHAQHRRQYLENYLNNTLLLREAGTVLGSLAANQVDSIVLKGAAFLSCVYPDPGLRPVRDIDLLVRQQQLPSVIAVLQDCGYRPLGSPAGVDSRGQVIYVKDGEPTRCIEPHGGWDSYNYASRI
jgi:hypothetical protein